jgi:hypothetical protein
VTDAYFNITTIGDSVDLILKADMTGTDAPRVKYADTDGDGISTGIADPFTRELQCPRRDSAAIPS